MDAGKLERTILEYIDHYTLVADDFMPIADRERVMIAIQRLLATKQLSQWTHQSGLRYWTKRSRRPLSGRSLVQVLARLSFCHQVETRALLTGDDLHRYFPQLVRQGMPAGYYVDRAAGLPRIGHLRVDVSSRISRIVATTLKIVDKHRSQPGFRELIDRDRFELTWIVAADAKQRRLTAALRTVAASGVRPHVCAIPELLNVIAPLTQT